MLPSDGLLEMFARPLERHVSRREFEGILSDLSVLYRTDEEYRALFERPQSSSQTAHKSLQPQQLGNGDDVHKIRVTHVSGEVKVVEIAAQSAMKLDKGSLTRRLGLLGIRDIQRLEVIS
ncbi:Hypothetical protein, putative [Bodo saltans]|uniref:Uncharacterized protein n=1 Tax=Bodo saltans TaxID=75058 RepID=A0A0S4JAM7_BODSA|nr:Hypothetical protein, putative [Bodo saltans]|eukprot:CUG86053.1 Hypothetical protein, putative [Bodo saltans]